MPIEIVRITALPSLTTVTNTTILPVVDKQVGGTTRKITASQLRDYLSGAGSIDTNRLKNGDFVFELSSTGTVTTPGSIIPLNTTTDLGTPDQPFRHVYAGTGSIYLGTAKIGIVDNSSLQISVDVNSTSTDAITTSTWTFNPDGNLYLSNSSEANTVYFTTNVENVLYVSKSGDDGNTGITLGNSFLTIKAALSAATSGTTIFVKSGDYTEDNPVNVPANVAVVGDSLRTVTVRPANASDLFYVNNGCYLAHMTFKDHVAPYASVAFNPDRSAGVITHSPYVQNCTSMTTTGTGMRVDGDHADGLKSMVTDAFTQYNQGGIGIHVLNKGYAQLVSVFTICCEVGFLAENGGRCSITNSNSSFGTYALKADGTSPSLYNGVVQTTFAAKNSFNTYNVTDTPNIGDVVKFSNGNANYYTINSVTDLGEGSYTIVVDERVRTTTNADTIINFYQNSVITAAGHTFEWIGAGTNIDTALPTLGGVPNADNQAVQSAGGKVFYTGTDQKGDFRIGSGLTINNNLGTISGRTFTKSLFGIMTPYILAIGR
jgi:hypothetical protein